MHCPEGLRPQPQSAMLSSSLSPVSVVSKVGDSSWIDKAVEFKPRTPNVFLSELSRETTAGRLAP